MSEATLDEILDARVDEKKFVHIGRTTVCVVTLDNGISVWGEHTCDSPECTQQDGEELAMDEAYLKLVPMFEFFAAEMALRQRAN